jgi:alkaline phosphatase D
MRVEISTTDSFNVIHQGAYVDALPEGDFTAKALIDGLPAGQEIFYRIRFQDLATPSIVGEPAVGRFRTAPSDRRSISFVWSGDTAGQGWGIDESRSGMRTYATMRKNQPDFFIHNGDNIYADNPMAAEQKMPNGEIWKNLVTVEKSKPAETLDEFRGNFKYNLLDKNVLAFNAEVPIFSQWDDHEVYNNWWPGEPLTRAEQQRRHYVAQNGLILAARSSRAFHEYMPTRETQIEPSRVYRKISCGPRTRRQQRRNQNFSGGIVERPIKVTRAARMSFPQTDGCLQWVKSRHRLALVDVRFTPKSGHRRATVACPLCAISGHAPDPIVGALGLTASHPR